MYKIKLTKGLQINKEQISKLQEAQMNSLKGGNNKIQNPSQSCGQCSCDGVTQVATKIAR
ncbi:class I lanthipeptide [Chryseobacterium sp. JUb7]|uniref:class I lanthipeptide n=1 Tax=Chryseobacterium sp. JUb7 TaxID=2940599 RepID=UPI00216799E0|nr:class I lanthipeptide [Chryseobacterium sp. JUb7]MCS3532832.1 natural product precursor [Chryseobacterium sp. JUb7]MCS3532833.1 natural product precursor [Chryseobacterium sp. JUb7]